MFWNAVNNACYCFMSKFGYPGGTIYMSRRFYDNLEREMVGAQWLALVKQNSVRGMKIIIDDNQELFTIKGRNEDSLVITDINITKFSQL